MKIRKVTKYIRRLWKEWRITILFLVCVVLPVKSSLADWNWVPTGSMNPTILEGDLIYVDKIAYDLRFPLTFYRLAKWSDPQRGDIVVCFSPDDMEDLNGVTHAVMSTPSIMAVRTFGPVTVPQDSYFVMGDNRDNSRDSRYFGFVEGKFIVGKAKGIIGSLDITDKYQPRFKRFFNSLK
jgi:signal peptidase I